MASAWRGTQVAFVTPSGGPALRFGKHLGVGVDPDNIREEIGQRECDDPRSASDVEQSGARGSCIASANTSCSASGYGIRPCT
jgi:hypothetical protein